jgi:hypothetical protein
MSEPRNRAPWRVYTPDASKVVKSFKTAPEAREFVLSQAGAVGWYTENSETGVSHLLDPKTRVWSIWQWVSGGRLVRVTPP